MVKYFVAGIAVLAVITGTWLEILIPKKTYFYSTKGDVLINPYIGYAVNAERLDLADSASLAYIDITWRELEPEEGVYDWEEILKLNNIEEWKRSGKHAVFRFICDYPSDETHRDIPDWLYEKTNGDGTDYDIEYGKGYSPNYANDTFVECHTRVMEEIGRVLGQDDFVSYVELGSLGHWGEWHVYYQAGIDRIPKTDIRAIYVKSYEAAFPHAKLLMRRPFKELPDGAGVYNDMTGDRDSTEKFLYWIANGGSFAQAKENDGLKAVPDIWEYAPVGGEFTSGTPMEWILTHDLDTTVSLLQRTHMSFIGPKTADLHKESNLYDVSLSLLQYVGYRYTVTSAEVRHRYFGGSCDVSINLKNIGTAPAYFDLIPFLYVEYPNGHIKKYKLDADLKTLQADQTIKIDQTIKLKGTKKYHVYFGIVDNVDRKCPIYLDMDTECSDGKYLLF